MVRIVKRVVALIIAAILMVPFVSSANAGGGIRLTYEVVDGNAIITGYEAGDDDVMDDFFIPAKLDGYPVTGIGDYAFKDCWYVLNSFIIPDSVISIDEGAFRGSPNIKKVIIPESVTSIGSEAFANCKRLTDVFVPASVTSLGDDVFRKTPRDESFVPSEPESPPPAETVDETGGIYEGEYDASGKRSGQGTWAYHNFLYAGQWENDLPNGDGTMYQYETVQTMDGPVMRKVMLHGNWVDGLADGTMELTDFIDEGRPVVWSIRDVEYGGVAKPQLASALNVRRVISYSGNELLGWVPPWTSAGKIGVNDTDATPWDLYEQYPDGKYAYTPLEKVNHTGMGVSPGNIGNSYGETQAIAAFGDWIFIRSMKYVKQKAIFTLWKMSSDGQQMFIIYEGDGLSEYSFAGPFQVLGDWLYAGWPMRMRADDVGLTNAQKGEGYIEGLAVDDWAYETLGSEDISQKTVRKTGIDEPERIEVQFKLDDRLPGNSVDAALLFADEDLVYHYESNVGNIFIPVGQYVSQVTKLRTDGSGEAETYLFREGIGSQYLLSTRPQIVGGRMYFIQNYDAGTVLETSLHSIDLNFSEAPITLVPRNSDQHISAIHVTQDAIYYGLTSSTDGRGAIVRADLDGGNPTVLADGFETGSTKMANGMNWTGGLNHILIAGDWMMIGEYKQSAKGEETEWYLMRLDGSDLQTLDSIKVSKPEQETQAADADNADAPAFPIAQGDKNVHVKAVQQRLIELGHLSGSADGAFGKMTKAAVADFQAEQGLPATGVVDEATYQALMG